MPRTILILFSIFCCLIQSCNPKKISEEQTHYESPKMKAPIFFHGIPLDHPRISKNYDTTKIDNYYPFILYKDDYYMVAAEIESPALLEKYGDIFVKYGFTGNGYSWEGTILQMIEKEHPEMIPHLFFDPEAGGFYVFAEDEKTQRFFADFVSKIFSDTDKLEQYLKSTDKKRVDD